MIKRTFQTSIQKRLFKNKAILLFVPRQAGKPTLVEALLAAQDKEWLYLNGDDADVREILT